MPRKVWASIKRKMFQTCGQRVNFVRQREPRKINRRVLSPPKSPCPHRHHGITRFREISSSERYNLQYVLAVQDVETHSNLLRYIRSCLALNRVDSIAGGIPQRPLEQGLSSGGNNTSWLFEVLVVWHDENVLDSDHIIGLRDHEDRTHYGCRGDRGLTSRNSSV